MSAKRWVAVAIGVAALWGCGGDGGGARGPDLADDTASEDRGREGVLEDLPGDAGGDEGAPLPEGVTLLAPEEDPVMAGTRPAETAWDGGECPGQAALLEANGALGGMWRFRFDPEEVGLAEGWFLPGTDRRPWREIPVPAAWDVGLPDLFDRQGVGWYAVTLPPLDGDVPRWILRFDGAFREVRVFWNGQEVGHEDLPWLPFSFDVTPFVSRDGPNLLVVRVDSRLGPRTLPCTLSFHQGLHGWMPWSGLIRPVSVCGALDRAVTRVQVRADPATGVFRAQVFLETVGPGAETRLTARLLRRGDVERVFGPVALPADFRGGLALDTTVPDPNRGRLPEEAWAPWTLEVLLEDDEGRRDRRLYDVAFRSFEVREGRLWRDGRDVFLHGMNRHEDHPLHGPVFDPEGTRQDVDLLKALHVDFLRGAHYPNDVRTLRAMERAGIGLAEEVPVYQWEEPQLQDPVLVDAARRALRRMVVRDQPRPGVLVWSVANEIWTFVPDAEPFVRSLVEAVRALDDTRPTMMASLSEPLVSYTPFDTGQAPVDIIGINEYAGWYEGETTDLGDILDRALMRWPDKAFLVSEYGADALLGRRQFRAPGEEPTDAHSFSEEYQAWFHRRHLGAFADRPWIRGVMPWVLADFRMQWRQDTAKPPPVDRTNLKGLVDLWRRPKEAFHVVARAFSDPGGIRRPVEPSCGDGVRDPGEVCDGPPVPCEDLGASFAPGGEAPCRDDCLGRDVTACRRGIEDPARYEVVVPAVRDPERHGMALCNDGSAFAFRIRVSPTGSRDYVVSLRGGGFCEEAAVPCLRTPDLSGAPPYGDRETLVPDDECGGILDPDPAENPEFAQANLVFAWYCSSDFWAGTRTRRIPVIMSPEEGWFFSGRLAVQALVETLAARYGMVDAPGTRVLYHGTSSGAFGAAATVDVLADLLPGMAARGDLKVMLDAGFLVHDWDEPDARVMMAEEGDAAVIRGAHRFFQARMNPVCEEARIRSGGDPGDCLFGRWSVPALAQPAPRGMGLPVLVVQSLRDPTFAAYHNHPDDADFQVRYGLRQWADVLLADPGPEGNPPRGLEAWWFLSWESFHDVTRRTPGWRRGDGDFTLPEVIGRFWHGGAPERIVSGDPPVTPSRRGAGRGSESTESAMNTEGWMR